MAKTKKTETTVVTTAGPNKNFRLSRENKMKLANILDPHERGAWKRMLIAAQLAEERASMMGQKGFLEMFKRA